MNHRNFSGESGGIREGIQEVNIFSGISRRKIMHSLMDQVDACIVREDGHKRVLYDFFYTAAPRELALETLEGIRQESEKGTGAMFSILESLSFPVYVSDTETGGKQMKKIKVFPVFDAYQAGIISKDDIESVIQDFHLNHMRRVYRLVNKKDPTLSMTIPDKGEKEEYDKKASFQNITPESVLQASHTEQNSGKPGLVNGVIELLRSKIVNFGEGLLSGNERTILSHAENIARGYPSHLDRVNFDAHNAPDYLGIWDESYLARAIDEGYLTEEQIRNIAFDHEDTPEIYVAERKVHIENIKQAVHRLFFDPFR